MGDFGPRGRLGSTPGHTPAPLLARISPLGCPDTKAADGGALGRRKRPITDLVAYCPICPCGLLLHSVQEFSAQGRRKQWHSAKERAQGPALVSSVAALVTREGLGGSRRNDGVAEATYINPAGHLFLGPRGPEVEVPVKGAEERGRGRFIQDGPGLFEGQKKVPFWSGLQACSSSNELRGLSMRAQVRV